jgi:hypothetical protein
MIFSLVIDGSLGDLLNIAFQILKNFLVFDNFFILNTDLLTDELNFLVSLLLDLLQVLVLELEVLALSLDSVQLILESKIGSKFSQKSKKNRN